MSNAQFPQKTAGDLTLPNGDTVHVRTLNALLQEEADSEARLHAANKCMRFMKKGSEYPAIMTDIRSKSEMEQAQLVAMGEWFTIKTESEGKYPDPERPEQGDLDTVKFTEAVEKWHEDCKTADEKRRKMQQTRYDAEVKKALGLTEKVRVERAYVAWHAQQWSGEYTKRMVLEILQRAVRRDDDHDRRYFHSVTAVEDAEDAVRDALVKFYVETLATVKPAEIPTLPAAY